MRTKRSNWLKIALVLLLIILVGCGNQAGNQETVPSETGTAVETGTPSETESVETNTTEPSGEADKDLLILALTNSAKAKYTDYTVEMSITGFEDGTEFTTEVEQNFKMILSDDYKTILEAAITGSTTIPMMGTLPINMYIKDQMIYTSSFGMNLKMPFEDDLSEFTETHEFNAADNLDFSKMTVRSEGSKTIYEYKGPMKDSFLNMDSFSGEDADEDTIVEIILVVNRNVGQLVSLEMKADQMIVEEDVFGAYVMKMTYNSVDVPFTIDFPDFDDYVDTGELFETPNP